MSATSVEGWGRDPQEDKSSYLDGVSDAQPLDPTSRSQNGADHPASSTDRGSKRARTDSSRAAMSYPRKRAITACRLCRVRKRKCNNARPTCKFCETVGAECSYDDPLDHSSFDPASLVIIERLNQILQRLDAQAPRTVAATPPALPNQSLVEAGFSQDFLGQSQLESPDLSQTHISQSQQVRDSSVGEYMKIPASRTTADTILLWPVFKAEYPSDCLVDMLFNTEDVSDHEATLHRSSKTSTSTFKTSENAGFKENEVKDLVENFLACVHIKNPILDVETLRSYARRLFEEGPGWDDMSCLVLLACALGALAKPFEHVLDKPLAPDIGSITQSRTDLVIAESNYYLARRRIGLLSGSIVRSQCYFWSGVYLMYTLRPVEAWQNFLQASSTYHIYLKGQMKGSDHNEIHVSKNRFLEQRLYWSCFKSECEIRVELNLPESSISTINYPDMFPSPPDEDVTCTTASDSPFADDPASLRRVGEHERQQHRTSSFGQSQQQHSWYYYLSEIALRRIANSVLNSFYTTDQYTGFNMPVQHMVKTAMEFLGQLSQWYSGLPSEIRYSEDYSCIPTEELAYMTRGRALEIRSWIFRPFLYYAIHHPSNDPYRAIVQPFVDNAFETVRAMIVSQVSRHRHHGTWFSLRNNTAGSLSLIAAYRCGHIKMPTGWRDTVQTHINTLGYWENESADLPKTKQILSTMMMESN